MLTGQCYCGAVQYELEGEPGPMVNCHCRYCRRVSGAAFATTALVERAGLRFVSGEGAIAETKTAEGSRSFCRHCGGRLYNTPASLPGSVVLMVATLDEEPTAAPIMHVNVESKAPWYEIRDDLPQFPGLPPGMEHSSQE